MSDDDSAAEIMRDIQKAWHQFEDAVWEHPKSIPAITRARENMGVVQARISDWLKRHSTLALALLLTGCSAFATTPAQDRVYRLWAECQTETGAHSTHLLRVNPTGAWYAEGPESNAMAACLNRKGMRAQPAGGAR